MKFLQNYELYVIKLSVITAKKKNKEKKTKNNNTYNIIFKTH